MLGFKLCEELPDWPEFSALCVFQTLTNAFFGIDALLGIKSLVEVN